MVLLSINGRSSQIRRNAGRFEGKPLSADTASHLAHRREFDKRLTTMGLGVASARSREQRTVHFISLDAEETISKFVTDGWPNKQLFAKVVADVLEGGLY
jgi:hypothetical protein